MKIVCWNVAVFLMEHASSLLAVYNGVRRSGTGTAVNYVRKMGREIIIIDPITRCSRKGELLRLRCSFDRYFNLDNGVLRPVDYRFVDNGLIGKTG
jgi:hypothetical protein